MGFKIKRKIYRLQWPETSDLHGFEVDMKPVPIRQLLALVAMADAADDPTKSAEEAEKALTDLCDFVADGIVSWNLEDDDDRPIEPSADALANEDLGLLMEIVQGWVSAMTEVDAPLAGPSTAGEPSVDLLMIPVELSDLPVS